MSSNHLILYCPFLLPPSIFPSFRVFSSESVLHVKWPNYWSFSFSISPSSEYSGLISFRMDWSDFLAVQVTLKNLLQYHSSKTLILQCSAFFIVQLSHSWVTTGKTIALTRRTFVGVGENNTCTSLTVNTVMWFTTLEQTSSGGLGSQKIFPALKCLRDCLSSVLALSTPKLFTL